jgi:hypothetical protein
MATMCHNANLIWPICMCILAVGVSFMMTILSQLDTYINEVVDLDVFPDAISQHSYFIIQPVRHISHAQVPCGAL